MKKIEIEFKGKAYAFTYYSSWMDNGQHYFFVITDDDSATEILTLDHFFINVDVLQGGQYFFNAVKGAPEEIEFKDMVAAKVLEHHYRSETTSLFN